MLANPDQPYLLDVIVAREENVYPMIPAGGTYQDILMSDEDLKAVRREQQGNNI
jgi:acetolactate synthase-1/2/3 large subunit